MKKKLFRIILIAVIAVAAVVLVWLLYRHFASEEMQTVFRTEKIVRSTITRSIAATGTVEPEELVNVGAQVNGKIMSFGIDADGKTVDFGSRVKQGMVLAQIDDVTYKAELQGAEAQVEQAKAAILTAEAEIKDAHATELLATNNWGRAQTLYTEKSMTKSDYDSYQAAYNSALASTAKANAALATAKASLAIAQASLVKNKRNVEYCVIASPVDGIVVDRRVSIGQTMVSNQTASSIFLVAKDFAKMQVWVSVNEADIGGIKVGMPVIFSCDAFPNTEFKGVVYRLRLNATLSSNVVTYIVEVNADNSDRKLVPYLTANVKFIRSEHKDVLSIPTSVIRFTPEEQFRDPAYPVPAAEKREAVLWVKSSGQNLLKPVKVKTGLNNGQMIELVTDELKEGDFIVSGAGKMTAAEAAKSGADAVSNPFMPNMPKFPKRGSAGARERAQERSQGAK